MVFVIGSLSLNWDVKRSFNGSSCFLLMIYTEVLIFLFRLGTNSKVGLNFLLSCDSGPCS